MVNTGVAIVLLTKKWVDAYGLAMKEKVAKYISGANSRAVQIMGRNSISLLLAPTLEVDVATVTLCSGGFY